MASPAIFVPGLPPTTLENVESGRSAYCSRGWIEPPQDFEPRAGFALHPFFRDIPGHVVPVGAEYRYVRGKKERACPAQYVCPLTLQQLVAATRLANPYAADGLTSDPVGLKAYRSHIAKLIKKRDETTPHIAIADIGGVRSPQDYASAMETLRKWVVAEAGARAVAPVTEYVQKVLHNITLSCLGDVSDFINNYFVLIFKDPRYAFFMVGTQVARVGADGSVSLREGQGVGIVVSKIPETTHRKVNVLHMSPAPVTAMSDKGTMQLQLYHAEPTATFGIGPEDDAEPNPIPPTPVRAVHLLTPPPDATKPGLASVLIAENGGDGEAI